MIAATGRLSACLTERRSSRGHEVPSLVFDHRVAKACLIRFGGLQERHEAGCGVAVRSPACGNDFLYFVFSEGKQYVA